MQKFSLMLQTSKEMISNSCCETLSRWNIKSVDETLVCEHSKESYWARGGGGLPYETDRDVLRLA